MRRLPDLLKRFRKDERGVFAVIFALLAVVIIATSGAVVDFTRVQQARTRAQIALDAAALALQAKISTRTATQLKSDAQALLTERIGDSSVTAVVETATPDTGSGKLTLSGYISVPTYFVQLVGIKDIRSTMLSEVTRSSSDIEVSVSLDVTGSMAKVTCGRFSWGCVPSDKIGDLITATNSLIDLLVATTQTPTYSKMAIVPWSTSANLSSTYAANVRGTPNTATKTISSVASWSSGSAVSISSITRGSTTTINKNSHGFAAGDTIAFSGVSNLSNNGNSCINGKSFVISSKTSNAFVIPLDTSSCSNASNNTGTMQKCVNVNCELTITSNGHGKSDGDPIYISGATGMSGLNGPAFVAGKTTNTMRLQGIYGPSTSGTYTANSGKIYCGAYGCSYRTFTSAAGTIAGFPVSNCVTDRTTDPFIDTAPSTTKLGYHYSSTGTCIDQAIQPLTSDKTVLHALANSLVAGGSTAGHLGLAWGWYMISPNFAYLWPTASKPKAYGSSNLIKAVVFMTDGVFNTPYCSGVVGNDALDGAVGTSGQINCASPNGSSKDQATAICNSIKATANHTLLYVVGFDLAGDTDSLNFLKGCATSVDYFFQADNGADLTNAFKSIAQSLSELRISK